MLGKSKDIHCRRRAILRILVESRKRNEMRHLEEAYPGYCQAVDVGGCDASHHSADLRYLVKHGFAEIKTQTYLRNRFYRATDAGTTLVDPTNTAEGR